RPICWKRRKPREVPGLPGASLVEPAAGGNRGKMSLRRFELPCAGAYQIPRKRGPLQPGNTGRGTRNPFGGEPNGFFVWSVEMNNTTDKRGFTTAILPSDRGYTTTRGGSPPRAPPLRPWLRDRARRAAKADAHVGRVRLLRRTRARRRIP